MAHAVSGGSPAQASPWPVIITEWALDSYLRLAHANVFTSTEYSATLRPDVELLRDGIPSPHPKFQSSSFWGPAKQGSTVLADAYKMKWRNLGSGQVQLRLPVASHARHALLCEAYVKANVATEKRMIARFKTHLNLISQGQYMYRGQL